MVTSGIVDLDESGKKFFLPRHRIPAFAATDGMARCASLIPIFSAVEEDLYNCFQNEGPGGTVNYINQK